MDEERTRRHSWFIFGIVDRKSFFSAWAGGRRGGFGMLVRYRVSRDPFSRDISTTKVALLRIVLGAALQCPQNEVLLLVPVRGAPAAAARLLSAPAAVGGCRRGRLLLLLLLLLLLVVVLDGG